MSVTPAHNDLPLGANWRGKRRCWHEASVGNASILVSPIVDSPDDRARIVGGGNGCDRARRRGRPPPCSSWRNCRRKGRSLLRRGTHSPAKMHFLFRQMCLRPSRGPKSARTPPRSPRRSSRRRQARWKDGPANLPRREWMDFVAFMTSFRKLSSLKVDNVSFGETNKEESVEENVGKIC